MHSQMEAVLSACSVAVLLAIIGKRNIVHSGAAKSEFALNLSMHRHLILVRLLQLVAGGGMPLNQATALLTGYGKNGLFVYSVFGDCPFVFLYLVSSVIIS